MTTEREESKRGSCVSPGEEIDSGTAAPARSRTWRSLRARVRLRLCLLAEVEDDHGALGGLGQQRCWAATGAGKLGQVSFLLFFTFLFLFF
jgi:hypothetical protein